MAQRERFERSDVPRPSAARNVVAVIVIVVVFAGLALLVREVRARVEREGHLSDAALAGAVASQTAADVGVEGYERSSDSFVSVVVFVAEGLEDGDALASAQLLVADETTQTAVLLDVPTGVTLTVGDATVTLADLYASEGPAACVAPLTSATGLVASHVIVTTKTPWDALVALAGVPPALVSTRGADLLDSLRSDLTTDELASLANLASACGVSALAPTEAATYPEGSWGEDGSWVDAGTGVTYLYAAQILQQAGVLVPAASGEDASVDEGLAADAASSADDSASSSSQDAA